MYGENPEDVMYYLTVYNEPIVQPAEPEDVDVEGILRGIYLLKEGSFEGVGEDARRAQLLASGVGVPWALEAQELLARDWGVAADVWTVTSWNELRRDGLRCDEQTFLHPGEGNAGAVRHPEAPGRPGPVVAVSDYMRAVPDQIRQWVPQRRSPRSAPTASASPTPGPRPAGSSRSTDRRSWSARSSSWPPRRGRPELAGPGGREVPAPRCHGGHDRFGRRRRLNRCEPRMLWGSLIAWPRQCFRAWGRSG